jgi:menaquinone-9 beta-reductase
MLDVTYKKGGFISARMHWDNFLFEQAAQLENVTCFLNHVVEEVKIDESTNGIVVKANNVTFKAKLVIGCDGAHSVVSKHLTGTKPDLKHYSGAVRGYYKNVSGMPDKTFEIHFIKNILPGYFWIFPINNNMANVGLGCQSESIAAKKMNLRASMQSIISSNPAIKERFKDAELIGKIEGFGLPLGSRKVKMSGDNFMLCGDAAALIDPATGEGIGQAIVSGRYAGWQAIKCFEQNNFSASFMKPYDQLVYKKFWSTHRNHYWLLKLILSHEKNLNGFFNVALSSQLMKNLLFKKII